MRTKTDEECLRDICEDIDMIKTFINNLFLYINELAKEENKIYIPSGQIDIDKLYQQAFSFTDQEGILRNKLANLPKYQTAHYQFHDDQGVPVEGVVRLDAGQATNSQCFTYQPN